MQRANQPCRPYRADAIAWGCAAHSCRQTLHSSVRFLLEDWVFASSALTEVSGQCYLLLARTGNCGLQFGNKSLDAKAAQPRFRLFLARFGSGGGLRLGVGLHLHPYLPSFQTHSLTVGGKVVLAAGMLYRIHAATLGRRILLGTRFCGSGGGGGWWQISGAKPSSRAQMQRDCRKIRKKYGSRHFLGPQRAAAIQDRALPPLLFAGARGDRAGKKRLGGTRLSRENIAQTTIEESLWTVSVANLRFSTCFRFLLTLAWSRPTNIATLGASCICGARGLRERKMAGGSVPIESKERPPRGRSSQLRGYIVCCVCDFRVFLLPTHQSTTSSIVSYFRIKKAESYLVV